MPPGAGRVATTVPCTWCISPTCSRASRHQMALLQDGEAVAVAEGIGVGSGLLAIMRCTAVAAVQRIIANNPDPTPIPSATATASPSCNNAIWWREARLHVGEIHQVQGTVVATRPAPGGMALLELGQLYPDPTGLAVLVPAAAASQLNGKTVCVGGRITTDEG